VAPLNFSSRPHSGHCDCRGVVQRNTNLAGVPLAANGDFKIDDTLVPPPLPRSSCATPVLLIRNTVWLAPMRSPER
jgi:hypothetical protein